MIKIVPKIWGKEEWLVNDELYCAKYLYLKKGYLCSLHFHKRKDETFYVLEGRIKIEVEDSIYILNMNDSIRIYPNMKHRFTALTKKAKILEVSTTHYDEDSYRIEEARKIKKE